jgi:SAM-dependent methyltransferase
MTNTLLSTNPVRTRWNGPEGRLWAEEADRYDRMLGGHGADLITAAALRTGEHVLDVGCGAGASTVEAAWAVGARGHALGVDVSRPLLAAAAARAADGGLANVAFVEADAQAHPFAPAAFDVVLSRFGAMLFPDPAAAFANLRRALRPDGRLAFVTWAERGANGWATVPDAAVRAHVPAPPPAEEGGPCAFSLADAAHVSSLLVGAGFVDVRITRRAREVWVGRDVSDTIDFYERHLGDARARLGSELVGAITRTLRCALLSYARDDGVWLPSAAWLVTARRGAA